MNGKTKILIVEADTPTMLFMTHILSMVGCDVEVAHTGEKAIRMTSENKFDVIAVSVGLPDSTGFEICCQLKQRHISRKTPIALIYSSITKEDKKRGFAVGVSDYIAKPVEPADFIYRIISLAKPVDGSISGTRLEIIECTCKMPTRNCLQTENNKG